MPTKLIKSASVIIENTNGEVLMCLRNKQLKVFPNLWVFPGGKIEQNPGDDWFGDEMEVIDTILKETYEEVGILPGTPFTVPTEKRNRNWLTFDYDDNLRKKYLEKLTFIGRKRTPNFLPKSFDTAYFHVKDKMVDNFDPKPDGSEIVEICWIKPAIALEKWNSGDMKFAPPTIHLLRTMTYDYDNLSIKTMVETGLPIGLQTKVNFANGIDCIPFYSSTIEPFISTNMIIINSDEDYLIVDPGSNDSEHLEQILDSVPNPKFVVITHHHVDHWEGLKMLEKLSPKTIVLSSEGTLNKIHTNLAKRVITNNIKLGDRNIQVIPTPGHTSSHISLFDTSTGTLIAGDHIVGYGSAVLDPNDGDMSDYLLTTKKLLEMDIKFILPAHGPPVYTPKKKLQEYIDHRLAREQAILHAINKGADTLDKIVKIVYTDVPEKMWDYAKQNIQLHINKLIKEEIISSF